MVDLNLIRYLTRSRSVLTNVPPNRRASSRTQRRSPPTLLPPCPAPLTPLSSSSSPPRAAPPGTCRRTPAATPAACGGLAAHTPDPTLGPAPLASLALIPPAPSHAQVRSVDRAVSTILSRKHQAAPIQCTAASQGRGCGALPQRARRARSQATRISLIPFTRMLSLAWVGDSVYASDILLRRRYLEAVPVFGVPVCRPRRAHE